MINVAAYFEDYVVKNVGENEDGEIRFKGCVFETYESYTHHRKIINKRGSVFIHTGGVELQKGDRITRVLDGVEYKITKRGTAKNGYIHTPVERWVEK